MNLTDKLLFKQVTANGKRSKLTSNNEAYRKKIPAKELRHALFALEDLLGESLIEDLIESLKDLGIDLSSETYSYSIHEVKEALAKPFGNEAADLLIERIRKDINKE